jgi:hypothetical protein
MPSGNGTSPHNACLVVVVFVPVAICAPAVFVFIPPPMLLTPATLPRIVQFTTLMICLAAVPSVSVNCLVKGMLGVSDPALTSCLVFCLQAGRCGAKQKRRQSDEGEKRFPHCVH